MVADVWVVPVLKLKYLVTLKKIYLWDGETRAKVLQKPEVPILCQITNCLKV